MCISFSKIEGYQPDIRYPQVEVDNKEFKLTLVQRLHEVFLVGTPVWSIQSTEDKSVDKITLLEYPKVSMKFYTLHLHEI